jgi:hypothetical protein
VCPIEARIDAKSLRLDVMSDGYFHWNATFPNRAEVEIGLRRAVAFSGRVLDREDRTPIPGAQISFEHIHCARCSPTSVLAGLDGEFLMSDLPDGESYFIVVAAGYPTASIPLEFEIDDPQSRQDLLLTRGVLLRGEVLDFVTGDALPGALIGLEDNWISSDASGRFVGLFAPSEDGSLLLVVNLRPRCTLNVRLSPDDLARKEPLRLRLPQSPIVEVRILDSNGAAIKGARILVSRDGFALGREQQNPKRAKSPLDELPASWTLHDHSYGRGRSDAAGNYNNACLNSQMSLDKIAVRDMMGAPIARPIHAASQGAIFRRVRHAGRLAQQHRPRGRGYSETSRPFARLARLRRRLAR